MNLKVLFSCKLCRNCWDTRGLKAVPEQERNLQRKKARRPNPRPLPQLAGTRTWLPHTPFFVLARASAETPVPPLLPATPRLPSIFSDGACPTIHSPGRDPAPSTPVHLAREGGGPRSWCPRAGRASRNGCRNVVSQQLRNCLEIQGQNRRTERKTLMMCL